MSIVFPSLKFFETLMEQTAEGMDALEAVGDNDFMFGVESDHTMFMIEFADRACVGVAPGGNPNDMDFVLSGALEDWCRVLKAKDADEFAALVQRTGAVKVECIDDAAYDRFNAMLPALGTFFARAQTFNWSAN